MTAQPPRYGSLFSGYAGLDMGIRSVLGGRTVWHSEIEAAPTKVLEHHWPDIPNRGDITEIDFTQVEPVDVLTGGFPCQDVSLAGRRAGMIRDGEGRTRSGLWGHMLRAIDTLRPRLVVAENVRGLLSAEADSDVEPCPWCMGDSEGEPAMRALGAVLADLAGVGYDTWWRGLRAADVGAPHGRFRVFIFATPRADTTSHPGGAGDRDRRVTADPTDVGLERAGDARRRRDGPAHNGHAPPDTDGDPVRVESVSHGEALGWVGRVEPDERDPHGRSDPDGPRASPEPQAWGPYEPAVRRWEHLTRPAPPPTSPGRTGPRLAPAFAEWLMGLPAGHVTDPQIGLTRSEQLKALGNGVVPQQAAAATRAWAAAHTQGGHL